MSSRLVASLHDCPGSPAAWAAFFEEMHATFGCAFAGFVQWEEADRSQIAVAVGLEPASLLAYHDHYASVNPWVLEGARLFRDGLVLPTEAFVPERQLLRSEFYNDFARQHDGRHGVAAQIDSGSACLHISLVRGSRQGAFGRSEVHLVSHLVPHVRHAIAADAYAAQLRTECAVTADSLDALPWAVIVLGRRPIANAAARTLIARTGALFSIRNGELRLGDPRADRALQVRVHQCRVGGAPAGPLIVHDALGRRLEISVIAGFGAATWARARPPIVIVREPEAQPPVQQLASRCRLTPREHDLVGALADTEHLTEAAERLAIARATARLHLARVFKKTGVHSQRALLALLRSWPEPQP